MARNCITCKSISVSGNIFRTAKSRFLAIEPSNENGVARTISTDFPGEKHDIMRLIRLFSVFTNISYPASSSIGFQK